MVCSSCGLGKLHCGGVVVCEGCGGYQTLTHCVFGVFCIFCIFCINRNYFKNLLQLNQLPWLILQVALNRRGCQCCFGAVTI